MSGIPGRGQPSLFVPRRCPRCPTSQDNPAGRPQELRAFGALGVGTAVFRRSHIGLCGTPQRDRCCGRFLMAPTDDSAMSAMRRAFGSSLGSPASDPISGPFLATDRADGWFRAGSTYPVFQQTKCCGPFAHLQHRSSCLLLGVSLTFTSSSHYLAMCWLGDFQDVAFGSWVGRG